MKKFKILILVAILIFSVCAISYATEPESAVPQVSTGEQVPEEGQDIVSDGEPSLIESGEKITDTIGRVKAVKPVREVVTGTVTDQAQEVTIEIIGDCEYLGDEYTTDYILSYDIEGKILAYELDVGDKVTVQITESSDGTIIATVQDVARSGYIIGMFLVFLLSIVIIGGKSGVKAIIGLLLTIVFIYLILVKKIFQGSNAIFTSIGTSILVIVGTFLVIGGFNKKILTAALGTAGGVISAGVVALIFNHIAKMSGACEDAIQLSINMSTINFNFRDLLFAGIIVSALGACMDVGMSIASSLDEIKLKNPDITWLELLKSGMNIGRDVIGTMTNTLILAYVGGSLTLILLFMACNMSLIEILNKETIAEQIISAIAGSMGVVYTVPITSFIYASLNKDKIVYRTKADNKVDGKRTLKI